MQGVRREVPPRKIEAPSSGARGTSLVELALAASIIPFATRVGRPLMRSSVGLQARSEEKDILLFASRFPLLALSPRPPPLLPRT